jgi:AAA family ATP:ADP antiporter
MSVRLIVLRVCALFFHASSQVKVKGKAAIDVICNPLGKSGGALIQQFMIIGFGSLAASTPYLGVILLGIVLMWIQAANSLSGQFAEAQRVR